MILFTAEKILKNKILRAVDLHKFADDPLRVLRGVQFCARFSFEMDGALFRLSKELVKNGALEELAKERIFDELQKLLLKAEKPSLGFHLLQALDIFHFTEKTLHSLDRLAAMHPKNRLFLMLVLLCYELPREEVSTFLAQLTNEKSLVKQVLLYLDAMEYFSFETMTNYTVYKLALFCNISQLLIIYTALDFANEALDMLKKKAKKLAVFEKSMPRVLGGKNLIALGLEPSKRFSTLLNAAYEAQMQEVFSTKEEAISWLKEELAKEDLLL